VFSRKAHHEYSFKTNKKKSKKTRTKTQITKGLFAGLHFERKFVGALCWRGKNLLVAVGTAEDGTWCILVWFNLV
jgi:hypothetical protein